MMARIAFDWRARLVCVRTPPDEVSIQELVDAIAAEHVSRHAIAMPIIAEYEGKKSLPSGHTTPITLTMNGWQVTFERTNLHDFAVFEIVGGPIRADDNSDPLLDPDNGFIRNLYSLEEKFRVLGSTNQLKADYERWVSKHPASPVSLAFFDSDHFKNLNSHHTEVVVDSEILVPYQRFLKGSWRLTHAVGGDEFISLFPDCPKDKAVERAKQLCVGTRNQCFQISGQTVAVTISVGLACTTAYAALDDLQRAANHAEQSAKPNGGDSVVIVDTA